MINYDLYIVCLQAVILYMIIIRASMYKSPVTAPPAKR